ncbi:ArnT family glycosyltransferase [Stratiformator vulcanicus]|uniref:Uncharacterized protein n=1 Tax=Stratiformator vulcanicus TaxID=2527980 RepID=A0A517R2J6_9PLAN|nr:glycosyltransferase family 39 protein [Stratiformator vulcanicus]QDT38073.1 hypothetical protein Pan189_24580 [Stratiformator vulcanicus]
MRRLLAHGPLCVLLLVALTLRLVAAVAVDAVVSQTEGRQFLVAGDADGYWRLGGAIVNGSDYAIYDPPRRVHRMPGFPLLLALSRSIAGDSILFARVLLAFVGTAAVGGLYWLALKVVDRRTALAATGLAAISPLFIGQTVLILSETLFAFFMIFAVGFSLDLIRSIKSDASTLICLWNGLLAGFTHAAATFARPTWFPVIGMVAVLAIVNGFGRKKTYGAVVASFVGFSSLFAPWIWRNWIVTGGRIVPTTLWAGPSLYDGLNPEATGASDMRFFDRDRLSAQMSEYEVDQAYRKRAVEYAKSHPLRTATLAVAKQLRFWRPWPAASEVGHPLVAVTVGLFESIVMLAAGLGAWLMRKRIATLAVSLLPVLFFAAVHLVFVGSLRYRVPAEYPLLILSAAGMLAAIDRSRMTLASRAESVS